MKIAILTMFNGLSYTYSLVNVVAEHRKGCVEKKYNCHDIISDNASFKLAVYYLNICRLAFNIEITAESKSILNHNSGNVQVEENGSTLKLEILC